MVNQIIHLGVGIEKQSDVTWSSVLCSPAVNELNSFIAGVRNGGDVATRETGVGLCESKRGQRLTFNISSLLLKGRTSVFELKNVE